MEVGANIAYLLTGLPVAAWDAHFDAMKAAGLSVVRADFEWGRIEPTQGNFDFTLYDEAVKGLAKRGIRMCPVIDYSAPWSGTRLGQTRCPPVDPKVYADFARRLVLRYGPNGGFWRGHPSLPYLPVKQWEIWNEQNGSYFWPPAPDPVAYVALYAAARAAIRGVDATADVMVGGLINHAAVSFLNGMFAAAPTLQIDSVGLHPYAPGWYGVWAYCEQVRQALDAAGRTSVPINVTEFGWTTATSDPTAVSDTQRAGLIAQAIPYLATRADVPRAHIYSWTSREQYNQGFDWYGIYDSAAQPNESGVAFAQVA